MMQVARFYVHDEASQIPTTTGGSVMPFGSMFMVPGVYTLDGQSWDCTRSGLYRFKVDGEPYFRQRIVLDSDLYALMSAISHNHTHGAADEAQTYQNMSNRGRFTRWRLRCGVICGMVHWLMPQIGVTSRVVNVSTLGPLNGFDDGHIVLETLDGSDWRMWDFTNGCYWRDEFGQHLSASGLIAWLQNNPTGLPERVSLDPCHPRWDVEVVTVGSNLLDLGLYGDECIGSPAQVEAWVRRIFQQVE
jgi:hypothetical protein